MLEKIKKLIKKKLGIEFLEIENRTLVEEIAEINRAKRYENEAIEELLNDIVYLTECNKAITYQVRLRKIKELINDYKDRMLID